MVPASRKGHTGATTTTAEAETSQPVNKQHEPWGTARAFSERGGARTARERWGWGRVQEEGRVIGVRNNDGRAEEAAGIGVGRTSVRMEELP